MVLIAFLVTHKTIERKTICLSQRIRPNGRPVVLRAREQLRACVKWDLVDCYIFLFSNFVRQYFRFRRWIFFKFLVTTKTIGCVYTPIFKNSVDGKKE